MRRQLTERGLEFVLSDPLTGEPESPPATFGPCAVSTRAGRTIEAEIWFRCYGLRPVSDYLTGSLAAARLADGSVQVTPTLQVEGHPDVFALGDVAAADLKSAARAARQAETVVTNIKALIEGATLQPYEPSPPAIVIPLGPNGGASELPGQDQDCRRRDNRLHQRNPHVRGALPRAVRPRTSRGGTLNDDVTLSGRRLDASVHVR